jgi:hypothetical protein
MGHRAPFKIPGFGAAARGMAADREPGLAVYDMMRSQPR